MQAGNGVSFTVGHDHIYQDQADLGFDGGDGVAGAGRRGLGMERRDTKVE